MKIIEGTTQFNIEGKSAVAIGKFDGIHRGHQKLIHTICDAKKEGLLAVVFTFEPSPAAYFSKEKFRGLTTAWEKRRIFEKMGVDILIEYPLNAETAAMSPERFIEGILVNALNAKIVVCGPDLTFGDKGMGNVTMLREYGRHRGFEVQICDKVKAMGEEISSSLIREEVMQGHMEMACEYIGAPFCVIGEVVHGKQLGRKLGMPTVNIIPDGEKLLPPFGVYNSVVSYKGEHYHGITNIGVKPTVTDDNKPVVETYIKDFDEEIYGEKLIISLFHFKRPEMKFGSIEELRAQIEKDME